MKNEENIENIYINEQGYLRFPEQMRHHYGSAREYPQPKATVTKDDKHIKITYEFNIKKMNKLKTKLE